MIQLFTNFLPFDVSGPVVTCGGGLGGGAWRPNPEPLAGYITSEANTAARSGAAAS